jgi:hypothetical protein
LAAYAGAFEAAAAVTSVEAVYLMFTGFKRPDRLSFGLFFAVWSLLCFAFALQMQPSGRSVDAGQVLFALSAPLLPSLWLRLSAVWGRDVQNDKYLSRNRVWMFLSFVVSAGLMFLVYADPVLEYVAGSLDTSHFKLTGYSFLLSLFYLTAFLFGLYNIENCFRTAIGTQKHKLRSGVHVLLLLTGAVFFIATLAILHRRLSAWILLTAALVMPLLALIMILSLNRYDPARLGVVVTRRSAHASTVIGVGGFYFVVIGLLSKMIFSFGLETDLLITIIAALLVFALLLSVLTFSRFYYHRIPSSETVSLAGVADMKGFIEDISIYKGVEEIVKRVHVFLETRYRITDGALIERDDGKRYVVTDFHGHISHVSLPVMEPLFEWLYRYGHPIIYDDLVERVGVGDTDSSSLKTRLGFTPGLVVPLISRQEMVGMLMVGDASRDQDELQSLSRFLEAVAGPLALAIYNSRVTDELIRAREMESFHKISSFVLHDLKNSVGMLDLLLANARKNFDNPEFRESMLSTIGDAVVRQRRIISRLSEPLSEEALHIVEMDVNEIVRQVIDKVQVRKIERIELTEKYAELPHIHADRQKLSSVFENLIVNAIEAMPVKGRLGIETKLVKESNGKRTIVVSVVDTGKGMSREFIETRLFHPFASTKKKGLGIGLYQSYESVRQMGGDIVVVSEEGKGSKFEVILPVS